MATLTFDGEDIRESAARGATASGIFLDLVSGWNEPATVRGVDTVIPSLAGRVPRIRVKDARRIVLEGYVVGTSASDWATHTATLMAKMQPSADPDNLVIADGYLGTTGTKTIAARVVNIVPGEIVASRFQRWSIELESVAPDWTAT